jgi:hypothetical protein
MKREMFLMIIFTISVTIFAQNLNEISYNDGGPVGKRVSFIGNSITIEEDYFDNGEIESKILIDGTYTIDLVNKVTFLYIHCKNGENKIFLMIRNEDLCTLFENDKLYFRGIRGSMNQYEGYLNPAIVESSSFLTEGNKKYEPEILTHSPQLNLPWAEGVNGQGIGEKIFIKETLASILYISIGYISYDKPYLYTMNSRPKEINISVNNKFSYRITLDDTPNYQKIILPQQIRYDDILTIEICSVYEGTRFQDTCINNIFVKMF